MIPLESSRPFRRKPFTVSNLYFLVKKRKGILIELLQKFKNITKF